MSALDLQLNGKTMVATLLSPADAKFATLQPVRLATDPPLPSGSPDLVNPGVSVLSANIATGTQTVTVLFTPQWGGSFKANSAPNNVALASWSLTSH